MPARFPEKKTHVMQMHLHLHLQTRIPTPMHIHTDMYRAISSLKSR
jgi:hypothetical protein